MEVFSVRFGVKSVKGIGSRQFPNSNFYRTYIESIKEKILK